MSANKNKIKNPLSLKHISLDWAGFNSVINLFYSVNTSEDIFNKGNQNIG